MRLLFVMVAVTANTGLVVSVGVVGGQRIHDDVVFGGIYNNKK